MIAAETLVNSERLRAAHRYCRELTRTRARNFYYGLKLSPEPQRSALYAVYAWMRCADDLVDDADNQTPAEIQTRIDAFRAATDAALAGNPINDDPLWVALAATALRFSLPAEHFHAMLDGQTDDLKRTSYTTYDQLLRYCHRVASTVGLVCIEVWGYDDPAALELAVDRGIAFQLTNILRDYRQDYDAGRVYLPQQDFNHYGISPEILRQWSKPQACAAMLMQQIDRAAALYDRSAPLDAMITPCCRPTLWAMTAIYRGLLEKMQRNPSQLVLGRRLRLSAWHKGLIAFRAKWQGRSASAAGGRHSTANVPGNAQA